MRPIRRIIVKVGTTTITTGSGKVSADTVASLVRQIAEAAGRGIEVALVSSGAISAGVERLGLAERPKDMETLQAAAAVGQGMLIRMYTDAFSSEGVTNGQVLLTREDLSHRRQYLNARHTLERLFEMGVVPVINENDTTATDEITFGDNDMLAALVASLVGADMLLLLTDTAGLHTADPRFSREASLIERVEKITDEIESICGDAGSPLSLGGMSSKVQAAKVAVSTGVGAIIADGRQPGVIKAVLEGEMPGTYFPPAGKVRSKKKWIGYARRSSGRLVIDGGAASALVSRRKSLLPAGLLEVEGEFEAGDCVDIVGPDGELIGRGVTSYGFEEARKIIGLRSDQIARVLGEKGEEIVNRDEMVVFAEADDKERRSG